VRSAGIRQDDDRAPPRGRDFLDVSLEELWERLQARNARRLRATGVISREDLDAWSTLFEAPDAEELAAFDPPTESASP